MSCRPCKRRRGTSLVEFAIVCPITLFLIFSIMIGAVGIFRYQQVAAIAREASRWASVHGQEYGMETGNGAATAEDIFAQAIAPRATTLEAARLSYNVQWDKSNAPVSIDVSTGLVRGNRVNVTVTYQWLPQLYLVGPLELKSTSSSQMMY